MHVDRGAARAAALALLPMTLALAGAFFDERTHLGFSNWRSACRSAGLSLGSLVTFTLQLLPSAVIGALAGGLMVQMAGMLLRHRGRAAQCTLAAHGGCLFGMAAGLPLCISALPLPLLLAAEGLLATSAAVWLLRAQQKRPRCASVKSHTRPLTSA